jgi:hypothetical protein
MQIDIAALFQGQNIQETTPVPTLNLIDLTDPKVHTCEDHQMTLETDQPTSSGPVETCPAPQ